MLCTWELLLYCEPYFALLVLRNIGIINNLQHSHYLLWCHHFAIFSPIVLGCYSPKLCLADLKRVAFVVEATIANLEYNFVQVGQICFLHITLPAHVARNGFWFGEDLSFVMLFRGEINKSPVLKKTVNAQDTPNVTRNIPAAQRELEVAFGVVSPKADDQVTIVFVQLAILDSE